MLMSRLLWAGCAVLGMALLVSCGGGDATGIIYLVGQSDQNVAGYQMNLRTGVIHTFNDALQSIGNPVATGVGPNVLVLNPSQTLAFVSNSGSNSISTFAVNHDNSLASGTRLIPQR
jgi:DNA-binding beta-propeller fold protein YncE